MRVPFLAIIVGTTLLSPALGSRIRSDNRSARKLVTTKPSDVGLNAKCEPRPPHPCPAGSVRKKSRWGRGDYCECKAKKNMVSTGAGKCRAQSKQKSYFRVNDVKRNSGCTCPDTLAYCSETIQIKMHMDKGTEESHLFCSSGVCKVNDNNFCSVLHEFKENGPSDCASGKTCGVISQRCVPTLSSASIERNLFATLKISLEEASTYANSIQMMQIVSELSETSKDPELGRIHELGGDKSFHATAWEKTLGEKCRSIGLTDVCKLQ